MDYQQTYRIKEEELLGARITTLAERNTHNTDAND